MKDKILVLGAAGQVGTELTEQLQSIYGSENVLATDVRGSEHPVFANGPFEILDVLDKKSIEEVFSAWKPTVVYHLAALLSATAEANPKLGWTLNMDGTFNIFDACLAHKAKVFWPSSIAVFGPTTPSWETPQTTILEPNTVYGITKMAGERYCEYYHNKYGLDVRSIRYPGLIGWKSKPGGGTTDYAVDIFYGAILDKKYTSFLDKDTTLPMMHMEDAVRATLEITNAPQSQMKILSSYNIAGCSFSPREIFAEIKKHITDFEIDYAPDHRQKIADSWPKSINDSDARNDWNWLPKYDLEKLTLNMLTNLTTTLNSKI